MGEPPLGIFKTLHDARDFIKYDCEYGRISIWSIDGQPVETHKGSKLIDISEEELNDFKTPLIFCNSFPESPVGLTIGELAFTKAGDARRLKVNIHTPFTIWDKQSQAEKTIQGETSVYCKTNDASLDVILKAFGSIGKNLGDSLTLTRQGEGFVATEGAETRPTTAQAIANSPSQAYKEDKPSQVYTQSQPTLQELAQGLATAIGLAKWAAIDVNELADIKPETIAALATTLFIAGTRSGTICPKVEQEEQRGEAAEAAPVEGDDGLPF